MKVLQVIEVAYRATLEEQDDTIVWLTHAMKGAGADLNVLLRGNAVNDAVRGQDASGLAFGDWKQTEPPTIAEDIADRGLGNAAFVDGVQRVSRGGIPALMGKHDQIWYW